MTSARPNSGLEPGNQGIHSGVVSEPMPTTQQAQFWQAWAQMRMAASPATYTQWQTAAGPRQYPNWAANGQVTAQEQSMHSFTTTESSQAAQLHIDGAERSSQDANTSLETNSPSSLRQQQVHLKQWIEVIFSIQYTLSSLISFSVLSLFCCPS